MKTPLALTLTLLASAALAGEYDKKTIVPTPVDDGWRFSLAVPGWIAGFEGDVGVNGVTSSIEADPGDVIRRVDMVASLRAEASKGRFGIMGDFFYVSLSDGIGSADTVVKKVDLQVDQIIGELALRWRLIDSPRGSLDLYGGVRYVNLFQQVVIQPNSERIDEASTELVDAVGERLRNAAADLGLRDLIADRLRTRIEGIDPGQPPLLPIGPLGGRLAERLRARIQAIIGARRAELLVRVRAVQAAVGAARARAQARLDALKQDISDRIAREVESKLDTRLARTDDWFDPFIGLRGNYNFNDRFYATAKGDIGGFGVGSDFTWQAEAALGWHITQSIFTEFGYRAFGVDYEEDGLTYDVIQHGPQVTLGINF